MPEKLDFLSVPLFFWSIIYGDFFTVSSGLISISVENVILPIFYYFPIFFLSFDAPSVASSLKPLELILKNGVGGSNFWGPFDGIFNDSFLIYGRECFY